MHFFGVFDLIAARALDGGISRPSMDPMTCTNCNGLGYHEESHGERSTCNVCLGSGTVEPEVRGLAAMLAAKRGKPSPSSPCTVYRLTAASRPGMVCSLGTPGCGAYHGR